MEINEARKQAAGKCTDIIVLVYTALCHAYDLQRYLESIGAYKREKKLAVNRSIDILNNIYSRIGYGLNNNTTYKQNGPLLCDQFIEMIDSHIGMAGIEREMNIISFCCERTMKYCREIIGQRALFSVIPYIAKDIAKIPTMLHLFIYEKYDLSIIFNQQLKKLYAERNYE